MMLVIFATIGLLAGTTLAANKIETTIFSGQHQLVNGSYELQGLCNDPINKRAMIATRQLWK